MTDLIRLELGSRGNKTSECIVLIWSCCLAVPTIVGLCFFLRLQSYVYVKYFVFLLFHYNNQFLLSVFDGLTFFFFILFFFVLPNE